MNSLANKGKRISGKKDVMVAIRMPKGLVDELRDVQKINHFMDLSEEIRFIIRKFCLIPQISKDNTKQDTKFVDVKKREKLITDLTAILENLKKENELNE